MKLPIVGKDQIFDRYLVKIEGLESIKTFQKFNDDALSSNNIFISTLAMDFPANTSLKERKAIAKEWIEQLPDLHHVKRIDVRHRVDQEFFEAICQMKNLESLNIWMSTVEDLSSIAKLTNLKSLGLGNCSRLSDIAPIGRLTNLESLSILASFKITNYDLIGEMSWLKSLKLGGDETAPKNLMLQSLKPYVGLKNLISLDMSSASIRDKDYHPILELNKLKRLDAHWRMKQKEREYLQNEHQSLRSGFFVAYDFVKNEFKNGIEWWKEKK